MDYNEILSAVSSVGFPIFACVYMFRIVQDLTKALNEMRVAIAELSLHIREEKENEN